MIITTQQELNTFIDKLLKEPCLACDTETTEIQSPRIWEVSLKGIGFYGKNCSGYIPVHPMYSLQISRLLEVFKSVPMIFHRATFDITVLQQYFSGSVQFKEIHDTKILAFLLDENRVSTSLKPLYAEHFKEDVTYYHEVNTNNDRELGEYCINDCKYTWKLFHLFHPEVEQQGMTKLYQLEMEMVPLIIQMNNSGVHIDYTRFLHEKLEEEKRYAHVLAYPDNTLDTQKSKVKDYNTINKFVVSGTSHVYPQWDLMGAKTGRITCSSPNIQSIHKEGHLRECFKEPKWYSYISIDYQQAELRLLAHFSQNTPLQQLFDNGIDVHTYIAEQEHITRDEAKALVYGILYGSKSMKLDMSTNLLTPSLKYIEEIRERVRAEKQVQNVFGRIRRFSGEITDKQERQGVNFMFQSTIADMLRSAIVVSQPAIEALGGRFIMIHHDELVCVAPTEHAVMVGNLLSSAMCTALPDIKMNTTISITSTWQ